MEGKIRLTSICVELGRWLPVEKKVANYLFLVLNIFLNE